MPLPRFIRIRQQFERPRVEDIPATAHAELGKLSLRDRIKPGQSVALTAGSRGIANIPTILKSAVTFLQGIGAKPFLVPAMGSHGGGTAEGQLKVLESYGITETFVGAPIRASMDVVSLGNTPDGLPVVFDKIASQADHIGVIARVKPHTSFHGAIESGLLKMMMIGLGKHQGALHAHKVLLELPYEPIVRAVSRVVRAKMPIAFGLGVVENAYDETALIRGVSPADFELAEEELLVQAKRWMPRLPFHQADLLVIDEIGKEISGSGMDTNVVGRKKAFKNSGIEREPQMRHIFVRGLSPRTHGNGTGLGMADFTTTRLVKSLNYRATVINCLTGGYPINAAIPVHFDSDREVLEAALSLGTRPAEKARVIHIRNTLQIEEVEVSAPCLEELTPETDFKTEGKQYELNFDASGNMKSIGA